MGCMNVVAKNCRDCIALSDYFFKKNIFFFFSSSMKQIKNVAFLFSLSMELSMCEIKNKLSELC